MRETVAALGGLTMVVVVFGVCFLLFLITREFWCWYWKINATLSALQDIQRVLRNIDQHVAADFAARQKPAAAPQFGELRLDSESSGRGPTGI